MTDIWNKEVVFTDEDKQRLGITDEQIGTGTLSGYGNANTNNLDEISGNMFVGATGNKIGDALVNTVLGKGGAPVLRSYIKNGLGQSIPNGISYFNNKNKDNTTDNNPIWQYA